MDTITTQSAREAGFRFSLWDNVTVCYVKQQLRLTDVTWCLMMSEDVYKNMQVENISH